MAILRGNVTINKKSNPNITQTHKIETAATITHCRHNGRLKKKKITIGITIIMQLTKKLTIKQHRKMKL